MLNTHGSTGEQVHRRQMRKTSIRTLERWLSKRQVDTAEMEERVPRRRPQSLPIGTESSLLSKLANDFNDGFTKKKLRSQYWTLRDKSRLTSFAVSAETNVILIASYGESEETLRLYRYDSLKNKLKHFQSIAVPGEPILACELLGSEFRSLIKAKHRNAETDHDQLILTGHRDGVVNLISTSLEKGHAKIIKRFNHARYLTSLHENSNGARDEKGMKRNMRIRQLKLWSNVDKKQFGFVSLVDNHILVYDFGNSRTPIYQRNCPGIEAVDLNPQNMLLLAIAGSQWGNNGIALLDFTRGENSGCLFVPENSSEGKAGDKKSKHCLWLDSNTLVNAAGNVMRIWDIRYSDGEKCEIIGHPGRINAMTYHNKTNTLYSSDDHGYVITWDLSHVVTSKNGLDQIRKLTLCQSFQALLSLTEEDCSSTVQCGNVIVSPDIQRLSPKEQRRMVNLVAECDEVNRLKCLKDGALASLDSVELGIHELKESVCYLSPSRRELLLGKDKTAKSADAVPTSADESDSTVNSDTTLVDSNHSINPVEAKVGHKLTHTGKGLSPILSDYESLQQHLDKELHDNFLAGDDVRSVSGGTVINLGRSIKE